MAPKNSLSIRLAEPVVFLRGSAETTVTGRLTRPPTQPAMLRGLLVLQIEKPTKICSIDITLEGKSQISWPEGVGARRLDVTEDHEIFSATTTFFKAGKDSALAARRTASIGPGLVVDHEDIDDDSTSNEESHRGHRRRDSANLSWLQGNRRRLSIDHSSIQLNNRPRTSLDDIPTPPYSPPGTRPSSFIMRHSSNQLPSTPATSPLAQGQSSSSSLVNGSGNASIRSRLSDHDSSEQYLGTSSPLRLESSASSLADTYGSGYGSIMPESSTAAERSFSRGRPRVSTVTNGASRASSQAASTVPPSPMTPARPTLQSQPSSGNNSILIAHPHMANDGENRTPSHSPHRDRGRRHTRFSLMSVSNALLDAVKERVRSRSKDYHRSPAVSRDRSPEPPRGMSRHRDKSPSSERGRQASRTHDSTNKQKEKSTFSRIGDALGLDMESSGGDGESENWKEFRKGIYTYPISIVIPPNTPPSLQCDFGAVAYRLKATVHRPGTFTHRMTASRTVTLIASPGEDDVEESDNIVVQREWDSQMHYQIIISGRTFPIGSTIPIHVTFMPIAKVKIYRISAVLEEKVEYMTQGKRVARAEPVHKFELLSVRHYTREPFQILPLTTDYADSPLKGLIEADDASDAASNLMGPGPWDVIANLELPKSCSRMHFTNKHKKSNILITHTLKLVFRVERGDDEYVDARTGLRKHFDIVVQTPMHILSCHCNYEWTSLPRYSSLGINPLARMQDCPCSQRECNDSAQPNDGSEYSLPFRASHAQHYTPVATPLTPSMHAFRTPDLHSELPVVGEHQREEESFIDDGQPLSRLNASAFSEVESMFRHNAQFERLVAGEESEMGDAPPRYENIASHENALGLQATTDVIELR